MQPTNQSQVSQGKGDKKVVSKSTSTAIKTCNGMKTKRVTVTIKYSDGSEETKVEENTYKA